MAQVVLRGVSREYPGGVRAVDHLDLEVADGEFLVIVGPSGCGKSTTLRLIAGLDRPTAGSIRIGERVVDNDPPRKRNVAMTFQNPALHSHLTVYGNLAFGPRMRCADNWLSRAWWRLARPAVAQQMARERHALPARVREAASTVGIVPLLDRRPAELSGGERQRAALAGAVLRRPSVFLFDEPLSNLDAPLRAQLRSEIADLRRRVAGTVVYVTHDQAEAMTLGDRIAVLDTGRLQQVGTPLEVYHNPANRYVAALVGSPAMNFVAGVLRHDAGNSANCRFEADGWSVSVPASSVEFLRSRLGQPIVLGIRPTDIRLQPPDQNAAESRVAASSIIADYVEANCVTVERLGDATIVHLDMAQVKTGQQAAADRMTSSAGQPRFICKADAGLVIRTGNRVRAGLDFRRAYWFDAESGVNLAPAKVPSTAERPAA